MTTCASCEKTIKDYARWYESEEDKAFLSEIKVRNIYEYIRENNLKFKLKNPAKVTFHKPCSINNFEDVEWVLNNTENLEYVQMEDYDKCCGLSGIPKVKEIPVLSKVFEEKRNNILNTDAKIVLTACMGCVIALNLFSGGKYKVFDLIDFIENNI